MARRSSTDPDMPVAGEGTPDAPAHVDPSHADSSIQHENPQVEASEPGKDHEGNPLQPTTGPAGRLADRGVGANTSQSPAVAHAGHPNADRRPDLPRWQPGMHAGETQPGIAPPGEAEAVVERVPGDQAVDESRERYVSRVGQFIKVGSHKINPSQVIRTEDRPGGDVHVVTTGGEITVPGHAAKEFNDLLGTSEEG